MSSVEVLGALDGYPPLLTIDEAAEVLRIGRSLAYGMAHQYESSDGRDGMPVLRFGSCIRVPRWALAELLTTGPRRAPGRWTAGLTSPRPLTAGRRDRRCRRPRTCVGRSGRRRGARSRCSPPRPPTTASDVDRAELGACVAARLGVAPNTAQRALAVLREAGLVTATQDRERGGRFGGTAYRLTVDPSVLGRQTREPLAGRHPDRLRLSRRVPVEPVVALGQQLVLLPSV